MSARGSLAGLRRVPDNDGHAIPITGRWCPACRYPLHPVLIGSTHPLCILRSIG